MGRQKSMWNKKKILKAKGEKEKKKKGEEEEYEGSYEVDGLRKKYVKTRMFLRIPETRKETEEGREKNLVTKKWRRKKICGEWMWIGRRNITVEK